MYGKNGTQSTYERDKSSDIEVWKDETILYVILTLLRRTGNEFLLHVETLRTT